MWQLLLSPAVAGPSRPWAAASYLAARQPESQVWTLLKAPRFSSGGSSSVAGVAQTPTARRYGTVFNQMADEYDRRRPAYPDELIDHACEMAGLAAGDPVLEVGCGTGQLTCSLVARGLRVTALDPGEQLIALAARNVEEVGQAEFVTARLEEATLPRGHYRAVFSASAFHWADPDISWRRAADVLVPGGMLALIQYAGLAERRSSADLAAQLSALGRVAPEIAAGWPSYRDLETTIAGVRRRRANVAEAWAWLSSYDVARSYAADLFGDVRIAALPRLMEHTAAELTALLATTSVWARLSPEQRGALADAYEALYARLGRPIRSSTVATLVTARRGGAAGMQAVSAGRFAGTADG